MAQVEEDTRPTAGQVLRLMLNEAIKTNSHLEYLRRGQLDVLEELRSINEGLRWQQEWYKTQTEDMQQALADRQKEAQDWQQNPQFQQEVDRRVAMIVTERDATAKTLSRAGRKSTTNAQSR